MGTYACRAVLRVPVSEKTMLAYLLTLRPADTKPRVGARCPALAFPVDGRVDRRWPHRQPPAVGASSPQTPPNATPRPTTPTPSLHASQALAGPNPLTLYCAGTIRSRDPSRPRPALADAPASRPAHDLPIVNPIYPCEACSRGSTSLERDPPSSILLRPLSASPVPFCVLNTTPSLV